MRKIDILLDEYGQSHRNNINKSIHWICVPLIFFTILGLLSRLPLAAPASLPLQVGLINLLIVPIVILYYWYLSPRLGLAMIPVLLLFMVLIHSLRNVEYITYWYLGLFLISWIFQFIGHKIEGKKPSFLKDIQFLLIGPAWLLSHLLDKWKISY